jgi:hypothetical protein
MLNPVGEIFSFQIWFEAYNDLKPEPDRKYLALSVQ